MERKNAWSKYPEGKKRDKVFAFAEEYRQFISNAKTERECTTFFEEEAKKIFFRDHANEEYDMKDFEITSIKEN